MEMASRPFGLMFGRIIFEFGIPVVPDLTTVVGNRHFPVLSGTTAPNGAVLPLTNRGTTAVCLVPSCSCHFSISFVVFVGLCSFFLVVSCVRVFGSR